MAATLRRDSNDSIYNVIIGSTVHECLIPSSASVEEAVKEIQKQFKGVGEVKFMTPETEHSSSLSSDLPRDHTGRRWVLAVSDNNVVRSERISRTFSTEANQSSKLVHFRINQNDDIKMIVRPQDTIAEVVTVICESYGFSDIKNLSVSQFLSVEGNIRTDERKVFAVFGNYVTNIDVEAAHKLSIRSCTPTDDNEEETLYDHYPNDKVNVLTNKIQEKYHDPGYVNLLYQSGYCSSGALCFRTNDNLYTSSSSGIHSLTLPTIKDSQFILPLSNDSLVHYPKNMMPRFMLKRKVLIYTVDNEGHFVVCNDVDIWKSHDYCVALEGIEYHCRNADAAQAEEVVRCIYRTKDTKDRTEGWQIPDGEALYLSKLGLSEHCGSMFAVGRVTANYFYVFFKDGQCLPKTKGLPPALLIPYGYDSQFRIGRKRQVSCPVKSGIYNGYWLQGKDASKFRRKAFPISRK